jgi:filamentous hemagglutinin
VPVRDLQPGDALVDPKGSEVSVVSVNATGETGTVHNFHVEELHTYHVRIGEDAWIRVHNDCGASALRASDVRFSQKTIKNPAEYEQRFREAGGWGEAPPLDTVRMPDGVLTSVDNTRLAAANRAGVDVRANVHEFHEPLPSEHVDRFIGRKGEVPGTWGDAVTNRIGRQGAAFRTENPYGTFTMPTWRG